MTPRPGGEAAKLGGHFEAAWTVRMALEVLHGRANAILLEPDPPLGFGAEFVLDRSGVLELDPGYARVAESNLSRAGVGDRVDVRVGPALESLATLVDDDAGPFDLIFIDADKPSNPDYLRAALDLSRPGTVIVGDNVVREGEVADGGNEDPRVQGVRGFHDVLAASPHVEATTIQTVGSKGYDGFTLALVSGSDEAG